MPRVVPLLFALVLAACTPAPPLTVTPAPDAATSPVVRRPLGEPPATVAIAPPAAATPAVPGVKPAIVVPADALYVCIADRPQGREQTVIEFTPKVHALCKRHPEMGPCQYERNACRQSGGRVYAANGDEITMRTEAEYDRKVIRVRLRSN